MFEKVKKNIVSSNKSYPDKWKFRLLAAISYYFSLLTLGYFVYLLSLAVLGHVNNVIYNIVTMSLFFSIIVGVISKTLKKDVFNDWWQTLPVWFHVLCIIIPVGMLTLITGLYKHFINYTKGDC